MSQVAFFEAVYGCEYSKYEAVMTYEYDLPVYLKNFRPENHLFFSTYFFLLIFFYLYIIIHVI
jgi:hypothetical protein